METKNNTELQQNKKWLWLLLYCVLLFFAAFARLNVIDSVPAGFFCDEASIGYNAYSILTSFKDEHGHKMPIFFEAFGEYKNPIQTYSTVPMVALFGLNEKSVRTVSAVYGLLSIVGVMLLTGELFKSSRLRYEMVFLSGFLLAYSPWHFHFSRTSLEGLMAFVCFTSWGTYLFLRGMESYKWLLLSSAAFAFAIYSYFPARIFIPIYLILIGAIYFRELMKIGWKLILPILIGVIFCIPLLSSTISGEGLSRFQQVGIFSQDKSREELLKHISKNYLSHYSYDFLFNKGDAGMPGQLVMRHSVKGYGEAFFWQIVFVLMGLVATIILMLKNKAFSIILIWWILFPLGSIFTVDISAQATRSIVGVVPLQILTVVGVYVLIIGLQWLVRDKFKIKNLDGVISWIIIVGVYLVQSVYFFNYGKVYFSEYSNYADGYWGWQYGPRSIVGHFVDLSESYDEMYLSNDFNAPYIFFKFYAPDECEKCFVGDPVSDFNDKKQLFAVTENYMLDHPEFEYEIIEIINYPNSDIAFLLVEVDLVEDEI